MDRFAELKARQAVTWGAAPFEYVTETFADIHDRLIAHLAPRPGERWLDLASGTGPLALRAARAGATVVGLDLAPALIATARRLAAAEGLPVRLEVGDCEALAHPPASFDVVVSSFGTMFAPDHAAVAAELARVCRPGGRLGPRRLAAWRGCGEDGGSGHVLPAGRADAGHGEPLRLGSRGLRRRLGDAFDLEYLAGESPHVAASGEAIWELYVRAAGPVKTLADRLPPDRREALHRAFVSLVDAYGDAGGVQFPREYLLVLGRRR